MRIRRIAVLIDGGFFIKRLSRVVEPQFCGTPKAIAQSARMMCKCHVRNLIGEHCHPKQSRWLDHVYRLFYYDAAPFIGTAQHPILNQQIIFERTDQAKFSNELFSEIRQLRKFALRLGKTTSDGEWNIKDPKVTKRLLRLRNWVKVLDAAVEQANNGTVPAPLLKEESLQVKNIAEALRGLKPEDVRLGIHQKGVDMRIGIDITTLTLKKQVDTIILVTGDSDFVPAAKVARREGVEFLLDPMWQSVNDDLQEHIDGVVSAFHKTPGHTKMASFDEAEGEDEPSGAEMSDNSDEDLEQ